MIDPRAISRTSIVTHVFIAIVGQDGSILEVRIAISKFRSKVVGWIIAVLIKCVRAGAYGSPVVMTSLQTKKGSHKQLGNRSIDDDDGQI